MHWKNSKLKNENTNYYSKLPKLQMVPQGFVPAVKNTNGGQRGWLARHFFNDKK